VAGRADDLGLVADDGKEAKFHAVAGAVVDVLLHGRVQDLTVSRVARRANVSRPWVYKYLGSDPDDLARFSARLFGSQFAELARSPRADTPERWAEEVAAATRRGFADVRRAPWVVQLYFRFRQHPGAVGDEIRTVEDQHRRGFVDGMPRPLRTRAADEFADVFTAARLGVYYHWSTDRREDPEPIARWLDRLVEAFVSG
jgi:AcrR family transcriptional regulator